VLFPSERRAAMARAVAVVVLAMVALGLPRLRRSLLFDVGWWDAVPSDPVQLPPAPRESAGLTPTARTRVVLIDGLTAEVAATLPAWSALCKRGITLKVDVGFPTVSLPVELAYWTGLTQQQTGIVTRNGRDGRPLDPPLDRRGIPAQVPGSVAIAENHGWIVRSLGFARAEPLADPTSPAKDANPKTWEKEWEMTARLAVSSDARLVFVHVLRVDVAGHGHGASDEYREAARQADAILQSLVDVDMNLSARWFVLSDHGHLASGGHGGEELEVRQVEGCIAGPGVVVGRGELVHAVDVARAIADSTSATLDPDARGRPLTAALAAPLASDQAVPPIALGRGVVAMFLLVVGLAASVWSVRRWWQAPWWFVVACLSLVIVRGEPTMSMHMVYAPEGRTMYLTWLPALALAVAATWIALGRTTLLRVLVGQLALPVCACAAAMAACGAWPAVFGVEVSPAVPRYTAWMSPLLLIVAHGSAAVGLGVLAKLVRLVFGRPVPAEPRRSGPAAGA
jgi:hypothetical protein